MPWSIATAYLPCKYNLSSLWTLTPSTGVITQIYRVGNCLLSAVDSS